MQYFCKYNNNNNDDDDDNNNDALFSTTTTTTTAAAAAAAATTTNFSLNVNILYSLTAIDFFSCTISNNYYTI